MTCFLPRRLQNCFCARIWRSMPRMSISASGQESLHLPQRKISLMRSQAFAITAVQEAWQSLLREELRRRLPTKYWRITKAAERCSQDLQSAGKKSDGCFVTAQSRTLHLLQSPKENVVVEKRQATTKWFCMA